MTVQLRPYQIEGIEATFEAWERVPSVLGVAATGLGKAQPIDAMVLTPECGFVPMAHIRPGMQVSTPDGGSAAVLQVFPQGNKPVYRVTFGDGSSTRCCLEHLWAVRNHYQAELVVRSTQELISDLYESDSAPWWVIPRARQAEKRHDRAIVSIEPAGEAQCKCILIDHPDHLYITDDFIVTHNTILFASTIARHPGRAMVIAHREELIFQAADKIERVTGLDVDIEMADLRAAEFAMRGKAKTVVSTVQTQVAGRNGGRMTRFNPFEFSLLVIDEAHHAVASTYRRVIEHYRQNPDLQVLGVTATPDRKDESALGQVFDEVAFDYDIRFGIDDGWLVPIVQRAVQVRNLDLSGVRTTAGDLNGADLARVLEFETTLHEIASPTIELTAGKKTLIFTASLIQAERLTEILNRHRSDCARWVHGGTPKQDRRQLFADYAAGRFQYLVNVGVATEGFDEPGIQCVVMARPTKSRALYCQSVGRGTRPLPGVVDGLDLFDSPGNRRAEIAASAKTEVEIIDFVGNSGRHRLITTADILGGNYDDDVVDRAREITEREGRVNTSEALARASEEIREERRQRDEARRKREEEAREAAAQRAQILATAEFTTTTIDPFDILEMTPWREKAWHKGRPPTEKQLAFLERQGVPTNGLNFTHASQLIDQLINRMNEKKCTYRQARTLRERGLPTDVTRAEAEKLISESTPARPAPPPREIVRY